MRSAIEPFPWAGIPAVRRRDLPALRGIAAGLAAVAGWRRVAGLPGVEVRAGLPAPVRPDEADALLGRLLGDRTAALVSLHAARRPVAVVRVSGELARGLADAYLGGPAELDAPRALSWAERGVAAFAVAAAVDAAARELGWPGVAVGLIDPGDPESSDPASGDPASRVAPGARRERPHITVPVSARMDGRSYPVEVLCWPGTSAAIARRPGSAALAVRRVWLDRCPVVADVRIGRAALTLGELTRLRIRDVVVLDRPAADGVLSFGRGGAAVVLEPATGRVIVRSGYRRRRTMSRITENRITGNGIAGEEVLDDVVVEVSCRVGQVAMSAREALELTPGCVLALDRPLGGPVDILCGDAVIGRGELVSIDGALGVRVLVTADGSATERSVRGLPQPDRG